MLLISFVDNGALSVCSVLRAKVSDCQAKCLQNFEQRDETINFIKGLCEPTRECRVAVQWAGISISLFLLTILKKCTFVVPLIANSRNRSFLLCL